MGPIRNGGVGTAYTALARALVAGGHQVTLLYTLGSHCEVDSIRDWVARYRAEGIAFEPLIGPRLEVKGPAGARQSHLTYLWLKGRPFDVVHFPEMTGVGFHSVVAKRLGLAFDRTMLCVGLHSPTLWHRLTNDEPVDRDDLLSIDFLEKRSVELADVLVSPSNYLIDWCVKAGWRVPERTFVQPYVRPLVGALPTASGPVNVRELAFFGRLEVRKGLPLFCDAVEQLAKAKLLGTAKILILGKPGQIDGQGGQAYLEARASRWRCPWEMITDFGQQQAVERLRAEGTLAVMPSLADNSPNTVLECLWGGIPFVSTEVGGIPELILEEDRARVLVAPTLEALGAKLRETLEHGALPARPASDAQSVARQWVEWHRVQPPAPARPTVSPTPLVSVCICTRNRPLQLREALDSLVAQSYPKLEVILVDDASDDPAAVACLLALEPEFARRGWRLIRGPRRYPGAARNVAAAAAQGEYLFFMDDDNVAKPNELSTLVLAALHSGVEILTTVHDAFRGARAPENETGAAYRWIPIGAALPQGLFDNVLGDTNMLVRRQTFFEVGRFDEEPGAGLIEDWVFLSRAAMLGVEQATVPEALFWYRLWSQGSGQTAAPPSNYLRSLRPYLEGRPPAIAPLLRRPTPAKPQTCWRETATAGRPVAAVFGAVTLSLEKESGPSASGMGGVGMGGESCWSIIRSVPVRCKP